jgi:hypothetical protein
VTAIPLKAVGSRIYYVNGLVYIGKEASNLERTGTLDKPSYAEYTDQEALNKRLLEITPKEAKEEFGIRYRSTLKKIKDRINKNISKE